jgi:N-acetylneuraminate synthase/N,N'-diacetyllegionaminate synthase
MTRLDTWLELSDAGDRPVYVVAEIGVNHNGDPARAHELIDAAAIAGADCVKFQVFSSELVAAPSAKTARYQAASTAHDSQLEMIRALELPDRALGDLRLHCDQVKVDFLATAFDDTSLDLVESLDPVAHKIPSGEITNLRFVGKVGRLRRPVIMSTGMADSAEVDAAIESLGLRTSITLMHCVTAYPTPVTAANLLSITYLRDNTGRHVGWSDHTIGDTSAVMAVALGSRIFEKHITLDRRQSGPDHSASADPKQFSEYVASLTAARQALGSYAKVRLPIEEQTAPLVRRSWYAARDIQVDSVLADRDLIALRPEDAIPADVGILGRCTVRTILRGEAIQWSDLATVQ